MNTVGFELQVSTERFGMKLRIVVIWVVVTILFHTVVFADSHTAGADANSLLTLPDYLTYAERNNAALKSIFHHFIAAAQKVPQARALPDPKVT